MKITPFVLLLLATSAASSQKIERYYTFDWKECDASHARFYSVAEHSDSGWHRVDYFVQGPTVQMNGWFEDTTWKVRNGPFVYAYPDKKIESVGRYLHGKKEGLWLTFHYNGTLADSTTYSNGNPIGTSLRYYPSGMSKDSGIYRPDGSGTEITWYSNGNPSSAGILAANFKKNGRWKYWHDNGKLAAIKLYDRDSLLEKQYYDENGQPMDSAVEDKKATFKGGTKVWSKWLDRHLSWPVNFKIVNGDEAAVVVSFTVDESGNIIDLYISTPFYPPFEKIALDAVRHSPKWEPAIQNNHRIQDHFHQAVVFSQPDQ